MRRSTLSRSGRNAGFTLIELLVVLGIIALLVGITLAVGKTVKVGGEVRVTQDTLRVLDSALDAYIHATGQTPDPTATPDPSRPNVIFLAADARDLSHNGDATILPAGQQMLNSVAVFYYQASQVPESKAILDKLPKKLVRTFDPDGPGTAAQPAIMTVVDAWGQPIRYVHPMFQGDIVGSLQVNASVPQAGRDVTEIFGAAPTGKQYQTDQIRRNHVQTGAANAQDYPDSDGGACQGARPYFYSAGPDKLVGLKVSGTGAVSSDYNADNVYTTKPKLPTR